MSLLSTFISIITQPLFACLVGWVTLQPLTIFWSLNTTCWKGRENISWSFCLVLEFRSFYNACKNTYFITGRMPQTKYVWRMFMVTGWTSQIHCCFTFDLRKHRVSITCYLNSLRCLVKFFWGRCHVEFCLT